MSQATALYTLKEIIGQALVDREYRELLFADRERALTGFELSHADRTALERLDRETLESQATKVGTGELVVMIVPTPPSPEPGPPTPEPTPPKPEPSPKPDPYPKPEPSPKPPAPKPKG
jgi:outer membrane biosynthesis protein TonB